MESKRSKKGRKSRSAQDENSSEQQQQQQQQSHHHPWDEVSLPGAGTSPTEQPTILLINGIASDTQLEEKQSKAAALKLALDNNNTEAPQPHIVPTTPGGSHLLDFESHLIESIADAEASGVGIRELTPFEQELQQGTSKVDTNDTEPVIEVEPAGAKTKQPVEISPPTHQIAEVDETAATPSEEVRRTAEQLVDEIEQELIQALNRDVDEAQRLHKEQIQRDREEISSLTQQVEVQLNELTGILKNKPQAEIVLELPTEEEEQKPKPIVAAPNELKLVEVPTPKTEAEEQERKEFIDSLPQIEQNRLQGVGSEETDAQKLSADCKREYYQSLKKYLLHSSQEKPPVPLQTYRWEDLKRAKERGGYPWTHLYKRPLGPDEQPEIVLLLRKSQELRFKSESPKSLKKVRYDEQVLVKETERYIQDLSEDEAVATTTDDSSEESSDSETESERDQHNEDALSECISCVSDSVLAVGGHARPRKTNRLAHIRDLIRRRRSGRTHEDAQSLPGNSANPSRQSSLHELAPPPGSLIPNTDKPSKSSKPKQGFDIMKKLKSLAERQKKRLNIKRITLKKEDKIVLGEQQKIMKLKASPKSDRSEIPHFIEKQDSDDVLELVEYDESPCRKRTKEELLEDQPSASGSGRVPEPDEIIELPVIKTEVDAPTLEVTEPAEEKLENKAEKESEVEEDPPKKTPRVRREHVYEEIGQLGSQELVDQPIVELESLKKSLMRQDNLTIDEIEAAKAVPLDRMGSSEEEQVTAGKPGALFAPISSIDSTSSDEERARLAQLSPVTEESDEPMDINLDLRPSLKKEASPAPSDKKVTFSHVEDEAEPHREDVELPEDVLEAATNAAKWKNESDHEYEPVGVTPAHEPSPALSPQNELHLPMDIDVALSSGGTTPRTESRTDYEIHTSQVDSSALEELPLQPENRRKGFMASAQDRTKKMQDGIRQQAGKLRTRLQTKPKPKPVSGSPKAKAKERRRFKAPEFSKIKMPEIKRPDMSKLKEIKRPEFTKFNKPDMSKFKLPEKFSTLKLRRSKSFKENEGEVVSDETPEGTGATASPTQSQPTPKKKFEFNFGTYPRAFRKKKPVEEPAPVAMESSLGTEGLSVIPSTETQPSQTSTSSPQGDRGPGPVRSRWADKFSDVSYNDSEGSRYRRYGSELESFDRESSLERRMKEDLEGTEDTASEAQPQQEMGILGVVADSKQFAEFDEENRAIHEISSKRSREFKRRPMVHQDSDLRSEDSRDAEGWTEKDIQKNKLLRKAELEAEAGFYKFHDLQDAQSTASSGKKVVMETIDDDEFFLRKRGISEDNIQLRQYISEAIREGYDMPNALKHVGYSAEQVPTEYGDYDVPPAKPRRLHRNYQPDFDSQEFQRSDYGDDLSMSQNGSEFTPKRPLRKARSRSKYSIEGSQDIPHDGGSSIQYFDDDEEYLRPPVRDQPVTDSEQALNNLDFGGKAATMIQEELEQERQKPRPQAPRRQKKRTRDDASVDKDADSFINGFGGRSVSNTFLQPHEDVIVYRTEHEYRHIPLATPDRFTDATSARTQRSEDDRTSRGADSLILDGHIKSRPEPEDNENVGPRTKSDEKFVIDMLESDGYAVVRKETLPKPTPPARRKKFTRSPGERFATLPSIRGSRGSPPPARPPPPQQYVPTEDSPLVPRRRSAASMDEIPLMIKSNYESQKQNQPEEEDDYEEPGALDRSNLQSGAVINKMKFRPLPPPPRPPREKRSTRAGSQTLESYEDSEQVASSSQADSYDQGEFEVEVSTQTDPLPDDFVCEEFEITEDMKIIEPRRSNGSGNKTLEDLLRSVEAAQEQDVVDGARVLSEDEQLAKGLQRFRDANQRSMSERSRASSQADRSKSLSRPQTPSSAVIIERRVPTPSLTAGEDDAAVQASLIVRPISASDLIDDDLRREEEELRREGLLSDSSVQSKSDVEDEHGDVALSDYAASSADLDAAVEQLQQAQLESDYESRLEDDEVERTLRDSEYEEEKYSEQEEEQEISRLEKELTEQELEEALEKELQEAMEKELSDYRQKEEEQEQEQTFSEEELAASEIDYHQSEEERATSEVGYHPSEDEHPLSDGEQPLSEEEHTLSDTEQPETELPAVEEPIQKSTAIEPTTAEVELKFVATLPTEPAFEDKEEEVEEAPLPPPRRKSTTALEPIATTVLTIAEQSSRELTPIQTLQSPPEPQIPSRLAELEVERLRVHALQAGQIQVSQLHGGQIKADDLECKSGQLVVQNIELPPGFIDDIVERVREQRPSLLTTETQTSRQASSEPATSEKELPVKPPRHSKTTEQSPQVANLDEQTQTEAGLLPLPPPPSAYPSVEYLQSLAPLAFYNLQRSAEAEQAEALSAADRKAPHKCRRRHVQEHLEPESGSEVEEHLVERPRSRSRRSRTRSATQPLEEDYDEDQPKTVVLAGRQFISACSLELVNIINQLTHYVRGEAVEPQQAPRNISALMVLFILITFGVLIFLLTGRQVHTHHWDYFNPPGNEHGRQA
ncbi:trichohyalin isoform X2 [Drosophila eugracilis]|uniref:trichohyalin isoform X2 n=1 Tax=Drosophila eugracilis TaxID=29029 RepID=UPI0007E7AB17|nr:trichohyalin isoform X2 [Drosophila eugracilis]